MYLYQQKNPYRNNQDLKDNPRFNFYLSRKSQPENKRSGCVVRIFCHRGKAGK